MAQYFDREDCFLFGLFIAFTLSALVFYGTVHNNLLISQKSADVVCEQLTNNSKAVASTGSGSRLVCEIPSFDSTQEIIIRDNSKTNG